MNAMTTEAKTVSAILRRWDAIALSQLAEHAARLSDECELAEARAAQAEQWAESWRDDFLRLCEERHQQPGITQSGHLVAIDADRQSISFHTRLPA